MDERIAELETKVDQLARPGCPNLGSYFAAASASAAASFAPAHGHRTEGC